MKAFYSISLILLLLYPQNAKSQNLNCMDLAGIDFGLCTAVLGFGLIDGECTLISGCTMLVDGVDYSPYFYENSEDCQAACQSNCLDLQFLDFGPCEAILGYGQVNGECVTISGCSTEINGFDFAPYLYANPGDCQIACGPICMDLYGIDFGDCDFFMGYAMINGECIALSGCSPEVDGIDYSPFIYEFEDECTSNCTNSCLDLANLDFGECTMPLGVAIINGQCTMISGCSFEVNGVSYESYFFESIEDCELTCIQSDTLCVVPEMIDSLYGCYEVYAPVCGCDGITYNNDCYARIYGGVLYWTPGECISGVKELSDLDLKVYPNPSENFIKIEYLEQELLKYNLYDSRGKIVTSGHFNSSISIDISYIKQGFYLLQIYNESGVSNTQKLIIK